MAYIIRVWPTLFLFHFIFVKLFFNKTFFCPFFIDKKERHFWRSALLKPLLMMLSFAEATPYDAKLC